MKVLLTGHLGYIGTVLSPMLLERGHDLIGLDSHLFERCTFLGDVTELPLVGGDVRDFVAQNDAVERLRGVDAVIHLAGLSNDPLGDYQPELTQQINTDASISLANLAKQAGVKRFVFASSCSNYGASKNDFIKEDGEFNPVTPYGRSKVDVELAVGKLADENFSPTFLRASTAYGVSPRLRFDLVVNNLTAWAHTTGEVHLKSDGMPWRPIVHVEDICRAYMAVLEAERTDVHLEAFNVGQTTENYQIREIAEIVRDVVPGSKLGFANDAGPDIRNYRVDCNYIARKLHHFKPQWTCRRGAEQLLEAYQQAGITLDEFEGEKYKRIAHIKKLMSDNILTSDLRQMARTVAA
ncbi:MAG: NAD(P)-dependent oxidoreductase [Acidimicrobiales bacterium]|nr:NAD(P)-dependent oxidoreductase [Hyphomonadaceae bacterium]RZV41573.1 MAG: NAD(P)-dependent oxidoreductase [Acidimicrobiales bacterium]